MSVEDIILALKRGELGGPQYQIGLANLIEQAFELLGETVDREMEHLKKIKELEREIQSLKRLNEFNKSK